MRIRFGDDERVTATHFTAAELDSGLDHVRQAPPDHGTLDLIVARPDIGGRTVLVAAELSTDEGLRGDNWRARGSRHTADGSAEAARQLTLMGSRAAALVAGSRDRWPMAGDQLYVDLDLSVDNLPSGTRVRIGEAVVEISEEPHIGCGKFRARFGGDALGLVQSDEGMRLRLRGANARVVTAGAIRAGDSVTKIQ